MDYNEPWLENLQRKLDVLDRVEYSEQAREKLRAAGFTYDRMVVLEVENELANRGIFSVVDDWVRKTREAQDAVILKAWRASILDGCGVKLVRSPTWEIISCEPDPSVPEGQLHEYIDHAERDPISHWQKGEL